MKIIHLLLVYVTAIKDLTELFKSTEQRPNKYLKFYENFYSLKKDQERKESILAKCKETMPVS